MIEPIPPIEGETIDPNVPVVAGWSDAPVEGDRIDLSVSSIVAGTPGAARVEIADDGLHAYDASGVETARIIGEEGVFVGGSFRTSDALPGQVTLSDDAYVTHLDGGGTWPGIEITPIDTTDMQLPAAIGPSVSGLTIFGGRNTAGGSSIVQSNPTASIMRTFRPDGTKAGVIQTSPTSSLMRTYSGNSLESGWVQVQPQDAELAYVDANNTYFSRIRADASQAYLYTRAGGTSRYLSVDADGVWVKTKRSGVWEYYNLEETAQDSGWVAFTPEAGITANNTSWRNKGGVMWFRGFVTATWVSGWNLVRAGFTTTEAPAFGVERPAWNAAGVNYGVRMRATGDLEVYAPTAGSATIRLDGLNYPTT